MQYLSPLYALVGLAIFVVTGLAVLGQVRWRATQEWESLADARLQEIDRLKAEVADLKQKVANLNEENNALQRIVSRLQGQVDLVKESRG